MRITTRPKSARRGREKGDAIVACTRGPGVAGCSKMAARFPAVKTMADSSNSRRGDAAAGKRVLDEKTEALIRAAIPGFEQRLSLGMELARGGMGSVREAFDAALQRRMAAKTMHGTTYDHVLLVHGF